MGKEPNTPLEKKLDQIIAILTCIKNIGSLSFRRALNIEHIIQSAITT
jgi:hypothetical protein